MAYAPGPYNGPHMYVQWGGTLPGGDIWSCGLRMAPLAGQTDAPWSQSFQDGIANAIKAYHQRGATGISARALLTFCKVNKITVAGKYAEPVTHETVFANLPGGIPVSGYVPPNQVALAVSLTTGVSRGPAHRGRFYLPIPALPVMDDGRIQAVDRDNVVASSQTLLTALNGSNGVYNVVVMSRKLGAPSSRFVTGIQVGRVPDTQRRRRNALVEAYS